MHPLLKILTQFESRQTCALPRLLVLADAARGFDLAHQMRLWPYRVCFVDRTFGAEPVRAARVNIHLASCSASQARKAGLNGVHWPHKRLGLRRVSQTGGLLETASAHCGLEIALARQAGITNILISTAFASQSPSAKRPLGTLRLANLARAFPDCALFALGGITETSARALKRAGVYGVALVSYSN